MRKYIIIGFDTEYRTFVKTEKDLREWAEEIRQNENLQDVTPDFIEKYNSLDGLRREGYIEDIEECIEFLEGYDWEIFNPLLIQNLLTDLKNK